MRAVLCKEHGPPSGLVVEQVDDPQPGAGEVVVEMAAAGLNFFDNLIIRGRYQLKPELPFSPGAELAGTVVSVGDGVDSFTEGDRVAGFRGWGCCAERVAFPAANVIPLPDTVSFEAAAGLRVTYGTSLHAFKDRGDLKAGESVAVLGAAGGIGQSAIEIAKLLGARVIACASSDEKLQFCREQGADDGVNYAREDLRTRLKDLTGGAGVDVVYDPVGGDLCEQALRATAWRGRLLVIGFAAGEIPKIPLNIPLLKGNSLVGVYWGAFAQREPQAESDNMRQLLGWVGAGRLSPHIHAAMPMEEIGAALELISARKVRGKVLIRP